MTDEQLLQQTREKRKQKKKSKMTTESMVVTQTITNDTVNLVEVKVEATNENAKVDQDKIDSELQAQQQQ